MDKMVNAGFPSRRLRVRPEISDHKETNKLRNVTQISELLHLMGNIRIQILVEKYRKKDVGVKWITGK
jgi:hypothetical protein